MTTANEGHVIGELETGVVRRGRQEERAAEPIGNVAGECADRDIRKIRCVIKTRTFFLCKLEAEFVQQVGREVRDKLAEK
jgi:hypothetical protein